MDSSHPELLDVSLNVGKKPKEYELYLLTFVFSKPMDAGSILQNLVVLDSNGKSLPLGSMSGDSYGGFLFFGTSDENPCIVYGFLADPLFYGEYTIRLGEETLDADGNPIGETMERSFTGGYVAPKILSVTPSLDFNERYSVIRVTFSSYMSYVFFLLNANQDGYLDPASVMLTAPDGSVARRAGHAVISDEIYDLYFDKQSLSGDYSFTVNSPYLDQNGNGIAGEEEDVFSSVFSVAATPDDSYPELLDVSLERVRKEGGEENINKLTLTFSKPMDPDSILENLYVFGPDGQSLEVGDSLECLLIDAENPCKVFGWFWKDLFYGEYTVRIGEETLDADGNPAGETMEYSFTGGFTAPKILSVTSSLFEEDGYKIITVRVTFSSFMTMSDMGNITLTGPDE